MMKIGLKHKGVTLVELLAVVVILGIIAAVAFVAIGNLISNTSTKAYKETVASLNQATKNYVLWDNVTSNDVFEGSTTNSERISVLFSRGYISQVEQPKSPYSYNWDVTDQLWKLSSEIIEVIPPVEIVYDFSDDLLATVVEQGGVVALGSFTDTGTSMNTSYGTLFIDNNKSTYTIIVRAQLTVSTSGGYGIFFETTLDNSNKDTGYVLQFDRGYASGEVIIRSRANGNEVANPVYRYNVGFAGGGSGAFVASGGTKNNVNPWWLEIHDIKLVIADNNDPLKNKQISMYVDNVFLFTFKFQSGITPSTREDNQTGLRVWTKDTIFYTFEIQSN